MATAIASNKGFKTVQELLEHLGDIPSNRVRLQPVPGTATERDVVRIHDREKRLCELVDGVLVEKPMGYFESHLACLLIKLIGNFIEEHDLGIVAGESGMLRLARGLVRIPDVSFVSWNRLPGRRVPRQPVPDLVPDLAIEVISPSNTKREMARKLEEYFAAGVRLVWLVHPKNHTVEVFSSPDDSVVLRKTDVLDGGAVLPGFTMPVGMLFTPSTRRT